MGIFCLIAPFRLSLRCFDAVGVCLSLRCLSAAVMCLRHCHCVPTFKPLFAFVISSLQRPVCVCVSFSHCVALLLCVSAGVWSAVMSSVEQELWNIFTYYTSVSLPGVSCAVVVVAVAVVLLLLCCSVYVCRCSPPCFPTFLHYRLHGNPLDPEHLRVRRWYPQQSSAMPLPPLLTRFFSVSPGDTIRQALSGLPNRRHDTHH